MRIWLPSVVGLLVVVAGSATDAGQPASLDDVAGDYVRLAMGVQRLEPDWIATQEVPESFKNEAEAAKLDAEQIIEKSSQLLVRIDKLPVSRDRLLALRRQWLRVNLESLRMQLQAKAGRKWPVQQEVALRYGFRPTFKPLSGYDPILARLDRQLSGAGPVPERIDRLRKSSIVPPDKVPAVQAAAFAECRRRTSANLRLPKGERVEVRWNDDPLFQGNNEFKGAGRSVTELSRKAEWEVDRLLWVTCHEAYPGHHLHFATLSAELFHKRGWPEFSVSQAYGPQVPAAEAVAEYGVGLTFPIEERVRFERDVLFPLAGLKMSNPGDWRAYWTARFDMLGASATVARDYLEGNLTKDQAEQAFIKYRMMTASGGRSMIDVVDAIGSYVIASDAGWMAIDRRLRKRPRQAQWRAFQRVLEEPMTVSDLDRL